MYFKVWLYLTFKCWKLILVHIFIFRHIWYDVPKTKQRKPIIYFFLRTLNDNAPQQQYTQIGVNWQAVFWGPPVLTLIASWTPLYCKRYWERVGLRCSRVFYQFVQFKYFYTLTKKNVCGSRTTITNLQKTDWPLAAICSKLTVGS